MLSGTKTPDGYDVNTDGAWVVNGVVQTKSVQAVNNQAQNTTVKNSDAPLAKVKEAWNIKPMPEFITTREQLRDSKVYTQGVQDVLIGLKSKDILDEDELFIYNHLKDFLNSFDFENSTNREKLEQIKKTLKGTRYDHTQSYFRKLITERRGNCSAYSTYTKMMCQVVNVPCFSMGVNSSHECVYAQLENGKWKMGWNRQWRF